MTSADLKKWRRIIVAQKNYTSNRDADALIEVPASIYISILDFAREGLRLHEEAQDRYERHFKRDTVCCI